MRSDRYRSDAEQTNFKADVQTEEYEVSTPIAADGAQDSEESGTKRRGRRGRRAEGENGVRLTKNGDPVDLARLKKKDLLEIMLKQGEEIDKLREQVADLQARLDDRYIEMDKLGSIAEASLALTKVFEEADKAARIYLENIRRRVNER